MEVRDLILALHSQKGNLDVVLQVDDGYVPVSIVGGLLEYIGPGVVVCQRKIRAADGLDVFQALILGEAFDVTTKLDVLDELKDTREDMQIFMAGNIFLSPVASAIRRLIKLDNDTYIEAQAVEEGGVDTFVLRAI